jgi:transposase-like protein
MRESEENDVKQREYVEGFKEQALAKVLGRSADQSVRAIAADMGMNMGTLRGWMKQALRDQKPSLGKTIPAVDWTPAQRLLGLQESHGLGEEALIGWCRERGIFAHDLTQWRTDFCDLSAAASKREESEELRQLRLANMQLQRDLNRKEKALAEAAALLVLQKKYRALWAAEDA